VPLNLKILRNHFVLTSLIPPRVRVEEITQVNERDAYHISVQVRSNKLIDLVYPVRDEHHTYVDVEHLHTLRYERKMRQGRYRADEFMVFDQVNHTARYESNRSGDVKEMLIPVDVQDPLSSTFWFRIQPLRPGETITIPVNADEKNWELAVKVENFETMKINGFGRRPVVRVIPEIKFQGLFVKRGEVSGWMSIDEYRIPLLMKTKVPLLGTISMVIKEYQLGDVHIKS